MAFVKAAVPLVQEAPVETSASLLEHLSDPDAGVRRHAARALSGHRETADCLAARLPDETDTGVRDAIFASLVTIGGAACARLVALQLASSNASLRNGAVEALKRLGQDAAPALTELLGSPDADMRILAVEVTRAWPSTMAVPYLREVLDSDPHVNVCGAAVDVATEAGNADLLPALTSLRQRFPDEPFLLFAVEVACSRIHPTAGEGS